MATVSMDPCELDHMVTVLRAAARDVAQQSVEVVQRVPMMNPGLEVSIQAELGAVRVEMERLAAELLVDAAALEIRVFEFAHADTVATVARGLADLPSAVAHDFGEGQENFQVNFQGAVIAALRPWAHPDYLTAGIGFGPVLGGQGTLSLSRSGSLYFSPGVNVGTPGLAGFAGAGHVSTPRRATEEQVDSYLGGSVAAAGGFVVVGGSTVASPTAMPGARSGYETGFGSPQAQLSVSEGFKVPFLKGPSW